MVHNNDDYDEITLNKPPPASAASLPPPDCCTLGGKSFRILSMLMDWSHILPGPVIVVLNRPSPPQQHVRNPPPTVLTSI